MAVTPRGPAEQGCCNGSGLSLKGPRNGHHAKVYRWQVTAGDSTASSGGGGEPGYVCTFVVVQFIVLLFETGSHYAALAGLELTI